VTPLATSLVRELRHDGVIVPALGARQDRHLDAREVGLKVEAGDGGEGGERPDQ
jgi:hypothetical protein